MTQVAVTDTHGLIWYALERRHKLGSEARALFERADRGEAAIYIPTIVIVELLEANQRGQLRFRDGATAWVEALLTSGSFFPVDLSIEIAYRAQSFYSIPERGDRLIAATAAQLDLPLISRDPEIGLAAGVEVVW